MKTREQNRNNKRTEIEQFDWFIERIQTRVAFGWLSEHLRKKTSCPKNFLEINGSFDLTSCCNTIGQSNNAFPILGFSLAGKWRVLVLIFSFIGLRNRWRTLTETIFQGHTKVALIHDYDVKRPGFTFFGFSRFFSRFTFFHVSRVSRKHKTNIFTPFFSVLQNQLQKNSPTLDKWNEMH